ncbi:hypothetical protein HY572_04710 [Candidatus Micrarchaeota archaeon]|nr:hypothetical protein [Candidatus Micrarchaeota archaeon]
MARFVLREDSTRRVLQLHVPNGERHSREVWKSAFAQALAYADRLMAQSGVTPLSAGTFLKSLRTRRGNGQYLFHIGFEALSSHTAFDRLVLLDHVSNYLRDKHVMSSDRLDVEHVS